jgi:hypothetical protein
VSSFLSQGEAYAHFVCEEMEPGLLSNSAYNSFMDLLEAAFKATKKWRAHGTAVSCFAVSPLQLLLNFHSAHARFLSVYHNLSNSARFSGARQPFISNG